jgi:hypothetical protein
VAITINGDGAMSFGDKWLTMPQSIFTVITVSVAIASVVSLTAVIKSPAKRPAEPKNQTQIMKSDSERIRVIPITRQIVAFNEQKPPEPEVRPTPPSVPEEPVPSSDDAPVRRHWHMSDNDICIRHGLHKVITHNGKSWRCR